MLGLMQDWPLLIHRVIDHAARQHGAQEVVSRSVEGPIHRTTYAQIHARSRQVASRLSAEGIRLGDRVATLAWNTWRHLESWYGIVGIGAIYHTVNPRLFPDQIAWIINHAEDRILLCDLSFVPLVESLADRLPTIERYVVLTDAAHMPKTNLRQAIDYESWIAAAADLRDWACFDENTAAGMCYTSGTTGHPKGVVYSHRSNILHSLALCNPDALAFSSKSVVLPVVPMFHANSWSIAFSAPMMGSKLVMPGALLDGASIHQLLEQEAVTISAGVPTVWLMLLQHLERVGGRLESLKRLLVGGSACPRSMIDRFAAYGVEVIHAWGMTELSPIGTVGALKASVADATGERLLDIKQKQGFAPFTVEMKITDDGGAGLAWDGKTFGRLHVRGPAVARAYFKGAGGEILDKEGYFDTGDVATIDSQGYMQITDRAKDVIKSGGEWISSIDLENLAVGHPDVAEAAVIGVAHAKWDERPLLVIVPKEGRALTRDDLIGYLQGKVARWWLPDDVQFVAEIPHTATGKINKLRLREIFASYRLPIEN